MGQHPQWQFWDDFSRAYMGFSAWEQVLLRRAFNSTTNSATQYLKPDLIVLPVELSRQ